MRLMQSGVERLQPSHLGKSGIDRVLVTAGYVDTPHEGIFASGRSAGGSTNVITYGPQNQLEFREIDAFSEGQVKTQAIT